MADNRPSSHRMSRRAQIEQFKSNLNDLAVMIGEGCFCRDNLNQIDHELVNSNANQQLAQFLVAIDLLCDGKSTNDKKRLDWLVSNARSPFSSWFRLYAQLDTTRLAEIVRRTSGQLAQLNRDHLDCYELLLSLVDSKIRKQRGVYFTPPSLCDAIVGKIDSTLLKEFGLKDGLGSTATRNQFFSDNDHRPLIQILDPSMGCGAFLVSCLRNLTSKEEPPERIASFISRLFGFELSPVSTGLAYWHLLAACPDSVLGLLESDSLNLYCLDTLASLDQAEQFSERPDYKVCQSDQAISSWPFFVVLGNPPFGALTNQTSAGMTRLMRGASAIDREKRNYFETNAGNLNTKKSWLHDLYVQFFRYGQWRIDQSGAGILAYVSNSNFVDNATFAGMRYQLSKSFANIKLFRNEELVDGAGKPFPIATNTIVSLMIKSSNPTGDHPVIQHSEDQFTPQSPLFLFKKQSYSSDSEFFQGVSIDQLMPCFSSAIVTARDWLVVDCDRDRLLERLTRFTDLDVDESEFRELAARRTRSARYQPGDTRSWNLSQARIDVSADQGWRRTIVPCSYRVMDCRWLAFHNSLVDWPRKKVSSLLLHGRNMALVTRKQMVEGRLRNYFWVVDQPAIDGIVRSDNRGNEFVFPLWLDLDQKEKEWGQANFAETELAKIDFRSPLQFFQYIYAMFWSTDYQTRFEQQLTFNFPRVFSPRDQEFGWKLAELGAQLIEAHLLKYIDQSELAEEMQNRIAGLDTDDTNRIQKIVMDLLPESIWNYSVGAHQVARKWLKDRRHSRLGKNELNSYVQIISCIERSLSTQRCIDRLINENGGWSQAFTAAFQRTPSLSSSSSSS